MTSGPYKIVFFGTSDFAVPILERLGSERDFSIAEVVTQPDRPVGRKRLLNAPPVKRAAERMGLRVFQPESLRTPETQAHLKKLEADVHVVVAYGQILPKGLLEAPGFGGVNVHGSLLPAYRGASPISAAIAAGERETGVTIMRMNERMDEGPELASAKVPITETDTTETLSIALSKAAAELIVPTLHGYLEGRIEPKPQDHARASSTRILTREDGRINWGKTSAELDRFVRAMRPWPEAFTFWKREEKLLKITLKKASILHPSSPCEQSGAPGGVCRLSDGALGVNCGQGALRIERLQLEGKSETDAASFLNGYPDFIGARLA